MPTTDQNGESKPDSACARPGVQLLVDGRAALLSRDLVGQAVPAADAVETEQRQRRQRRHDHEELQHLVVDGGLEPAQGDVREHDHGRDDQGDPQRPPEQGPHDAAEQVEVDAGDQQLRDGEGDRVHQVRAGTEPAEHELRNRADLRAVVERHHHDAEEQHRRDGAHPEVVHGRQPELRTRGRHPHDLDGPQVGRDEGQPRHPGGERAAREEEVEGVRDATTGHPADREHEPEVDEDDQVVDRIRVDQRCPDGDARSSHADSLPTRGVTETTPRSDAPRQE